VPAPPDLNPSPDGPERFAELAHADAILNDPDQRTRYDQPRQASSASSPNLARPPVLKRTARRGILELTPSEARHLARHPLTLTDRYGRTIVVPAGTGHGEQITVLFSRRPVVLTIELQGNLDSNRLRSITDDEHYPFSEGRFAWH
jgi:curved DNA-binding protein CbpA